MIEAMKQALEAMEYADACLKKQLTTKTKHEYAQDLLLSAGTSLHQAIAELESQEPVAWMHTKIDGVAVPHRPSDLDKHPERWEALYKTPPPCPTCEALARTVMLDQTSHDTHPPQRTWVGLTKEDKDLIEDLCEMMIGDAVFSTIDAILKGKNT